MTIDKTKGYCCDNGGREWFIHDENCPMKPKSNQQPKASWVKYWEENCHCLEAYKDRGMVDPGCAYCNTFDEVKDAIAEAIQEERRRISETIGHMKPEGETEEEQVGFSKALDKIYLSLINQKNV